MTPSFDISKSLQQRASTVIPNGIFGHRRTFAFAAGSLRAIPDDYPHFVSRASGSRFWDVDGNEFTDYLCGYGPMIVGYGNDRVDAAAAAEQAKGNCYDFPAEATVTLAERLVASQPGSAWAAFALNGTDVMSMALVVARAATGRETVVMADGAFHGNLHWASAGPGWSQADHYLTRTVPWGDPAALSAALEAEPVAAVVLCPYEQLVGADNTMPSPDYWTQVRAACSKHGTVLIIDDIRSGFRVSPNGTCDHFGIKPDLVAQSKALANGYPVAALIGVDALREAASTIFMSGTFWGFAPALAAAEATLDILAEPGIYDRLHACGRRLTDGLGELANATGHELVVSGPASMPLVRFTHDPDFGLACAFAAGLAAKGSLIHPTHNWFLSTAHTFDDIDRTLSQAEVVLQNLPAPG